MIRSRSIPTARSRTDQKQKTDAVTMSPLVWVGGALMVFGALMIAIGLGATGIWTAVVTVGITIATVAVDRTRSLGNADIKEHRDRI